MGTSQAIDPSIAPILGAIVGAAAALIGTFVTLVVTRWLDDRRWARMREHQDTVDRRAAYAKMRRTLDVWREAAVDLEGKPTKKDWDSYWAARRDALEAVAELVMIGSPLAVQAVSEALDQLLDLWWDYEVNGPYMVESAALWPRMKYIDSRIDAFSDLARAEFGLEPAEEDPRAWLETTELVRRRVAELRRGTPPPAAGPETDEDRIARLAFEQSMHHASRSGTVRRLELDGSLSEQEANALVDRWEIEAETRKVVQRDPDYWRQGRQWMDEQLIGRPEPQSHQPAKRSRLRATSIRAVKRES